MPHYKDGTPAKVGDFVRGIPYNLKKDGKPREVVGTLISVTSDQDVCNCMVAFVEANMLGKGVEPVGPVAGAVELACGDGYTRLLEIVYDYGELKAFEKIGCGICHWCQERRPFDREEKGMHVIEADGVYSTAPCLISSADSRRTS